MSRHDLSQIDLREGTLRIRLRRGQLGPAPPPIVLPPAPIPAVAPPVPIAKPEADAPARPFHLITSPTPGTFYARPKPDAEPYVRVGSRVAPETVVCQIEAMKIFN